MITGNCQTAGYGVYYFIIATVAVYGQASPLFADDSKSAGDGGVAISLKLLPSAPEASADEVTLDQSSPPLVAGDKVVAGDKGLSKGKETDQKSADKKPTATKQGDLKSASQPKPDSSSLDEGAASRDYQRKISDQPEGSVTLNLRPVARPVRPLEIKIDPGMGSKFQGEQNIYAPPLQIELNASKKTDESGAQECPGGQLNSNEAAADLPVLPGDIPLDDQDEHPFDAPAALSTSSEVRIHPASKTAKVEADQSIEQQDVNHRIETVLQHFRDNPENIVRRGPWALMHVILPYGVEAEVIAGNRRVNAIGWLCHNGICARQRMFQPTQTGFRPNIGPGVQGHDGQFLAILAQSRVQSDYPLKVGKRKFTIMDLVRYEMATCREKSELTFKLIAFSHYLDPNQTWRDNRGRTWSIEKLVAEELAQPINGSACGGTHRLMGLSCAVIRRQEAGLPMTGHYARAQIFLEDFVAYALTMQNPDGSFSTEWFERRADEVNIDRKIQTTGHILEWLVYTLPDEHLSKPEITSAVQFLLDSIGSDPSKDWPIGPLGHSLRALAIYQQRAFSAATDEAPIGGRVAADPETDSIVR